MENVNFKDIILSSEKLYDDLILVLQQKFLYQNIMIININKNKVEDKLQPYKKEFNFVFVKQLENDLLFNTDCVVLSDENINIKNIKTCIENKTPFILMSNNYISFQIIAKIYCLDIKYLVRIIINNEIFKSRKERCKFFIDSLVSIGLDIDENLKNLFYNKGYKFLSLKQIKNKYKFFTEFNLNSFCELYQKSVVVDSIVLDDIIQNSKRIDIFSYSWLLMQIVFNLYKCFFTYFSPTLVGKVNDFKFNFSKFWFVKEMCLKEIQAQINYFLNLVEQTKNILSCEDIDYFYNISLNYFSIDVKHAFKDSVKNSLKEGLLKVIYNFGLLEF